MNHSALPLLVVYPYPSLDTNPTMTFLLESLAARGVRVDVLLPKGEGFLTPEPFGDTVRLLHMPWTFFEPQWTSLWAAHGQFERRLLKQIFPAWHADHSLRDNPEVFGRRQVQHYAALIGVDPYGVTLAERLNRRAGKPLVYISFEIVCAEELAPEEMIVKDMERCACDRTSLVLIQDEERAEVFCRENGFARDKVILVPVAPPPQEVHKTDYFRESLGIPVETKIVLYCGNLEAWGSRDELGDMVSGWPDDYGLVIHNRATVNRRMERFLKELTATGRVWISAQPAPRSTFADLVSSADFGLAPYKPNPEHWWTGNNLYHLGLASGKVACYALCGLPILARSLPVFEREFATYGCGKIYRSAAETGGLLEEMNQNYDEYRQEAFRFYWERLNPLDGMQHFCDSLLEVAGLNSPPR